MKELEFSVMDRLVRGMCASRPSGFKRLPVDAMTADITVDARGRACPVPIVELARALKAAATGSLVLLLATDPAVEPDVSAFCRATGHALERFEADAGSYRVWVRKAGRGRPAGQL